jgi:hypothetical protein
MLAAKISPCCFQAVPADLRRPAGAASTDQRLLPGRWVGAVSARLWSWCSDRAVHRRRDRSALIELEALHGAGDVQLVNVALNIRPQQAQTWKSNIALNDTALRPSDESLPLLRHAPLSSIRCLTFSFIVL